MKYKIRIDEDWIVIELFPKEEMNVSKGFLMIGKRNELPRLMINVDKILTLEKVEGE